MPALSSPHGRDAEAGEGWQEETGMWTVAREAHLPPIT